MAIPLTPEVLVPRLGEYLVQQGLIGQDDIQKALAYQDEKQRTGVHCLLGQALMDLHLLSREQIDQAVTEQIIQLRNALEDANKFLEHRVAERTVELQEALRKLSELSQMKANFVANISHELRTPLTHVKGYLELLATETLGQINTEQKSALEISQRAAGRLESLIDNLIVFSMAARGEMTLQLTPVDLNHIVEEIIKYCRIKATEHQVDIIFVPRTGIPSVNVDKEKISWAILQLVDNAIKFTPSGGQVTVSIAPESDSMLRVSVMDTGIGIPSEKQQEVFEPFHQLDGSPSRRFGGTGLGLALAREIVSAHGSTIEINSNEGKGSIFHFSLISIKAGT